MLVTLIDPIEIGQADRALKGPKLGYLDQKIQDCGYLPFFNMAPQVVLEVALCDKRLVAPRVSASMFPRIRMYTLMNEQIAALDEGFVAAFVPTSKRLRP